MQHTYDSLLLVKDGVLSRECNSKMKARRGLIQLKYSELKGNVQGSDSSF